MKDFLFLGKGLSSRVAIFQSLHTARLYSTEVAEALSDKHNVKAEVIDLRSIRPLDEATIIESVKKTNRVLLVEEISHSAGLMLKYAF